MNKTVEAFLWIVFIGLMSLSMGCAETRKLFVPPKCHPAEVLPNGDGTFTIYPDPCAR